MVILDIHWRAWGNYIFIEELSFNFLTLHYATLIVLF